MRFLKKSNAQVAAVAPEPEPEPEPQPEEPVKEVATVSEDSMDASIGVIIQINVKTSGDVIDEVAKEGITIKVNDKAISLETSASVEESKKFVDDLQQAVSHDVTTKQEEEEQQQKKSVTTIPSVLDKLMFWKAIKTEKKEESGVEESKEQEETVEKKEEEEVEPVAEANSEVPKEEIVEKKEEEEAEPAAAEAEASQEESVEKKEEAEPVAEVEAPKEQEESSSSPFSYLQNKLTFWQDEASKEQKEEEPVAEEKVKAAEAQVEVKVEQKQVEEEAFSHKIEVFVDGAAIQTIRLTNAGMDHLKNFIASVQEEARLKGEEIAVTQAWLAEKMSEFFETAKVQGDAVVSSDEAAPTTTPSDAAASIKDETTSAEVETQPAAKGSWWPFSTTETTEEKAVDETRNETATAEEVKEDTTEQMREVAEAA